MHGTPTRGATHAPTPVNKGIWSHHGNHQHGVQFYSQDKFLLEELSEYIGNALRLGDAAVVVATEQHRNALLQWLAARGLDVTRLLERGQFIALDARAVLDSFMSEGLPNEDRFNRVIGGIIAKAIASATGDSARSEHPRVAIFGEMVALLWADGKADAAIRLEQLWNGLARIESFSLLCAYPMACFEREQDTELFLKVCNEHSSVVPTESYMGLASEDERLRTISQLQQKAKALETEVAEHRRLRQELELHVQARTAELQSKNSQLLEEIKRRENAETSLRTLTSQLMLIRDEERRRVAHELHESTAQVLATLSMNLSVLGDGDRENAHELKLIGESSTLVDGLLGEVRQLSHLLHPPTLDEMGLSSAIQWYSEKFAQRTNITVAVEISSDFGRLSREKEIAVFRVVQESLANVQEHSGSATASVRITKSAGHICVQVSDLGKGMSFPRSSLSVAGVGINGMRERLRQLGGVLNIHSTSRGTLVTADLPVD